jgi:hypothetical protein
MPSKVCVGRYEKQINGSKFDICVLWIKEKMKPCYSSHLEISIVPCVRIRGNP